MLTIYEYQIVEKHCAQSNLTFLLNPRRGQGLFVLHSQFITSTVTMQKADTDTEEHNYFDYYFGQIVQCIA